MSVAEARVCEQCGEPFVTVHRTQRYCSPACRNRHWVEGRPEARREAIRRYREANREKVREANRRWRQSGNVADITRRYRAENPEKAAAHYQVANALRAGRLIRPEACEQCGGNESLHAHHPDYSRPLDVVWLCPLCHKAEHQEAA